MEPVGKGFDVTRSIFKAIGTVCTTVVGFANMGLTQAANGDNVFDLKTAIKNYTGKAMEKAGVGRTDTNGGFNGNGLNVFGEIFKNKNGKTLADFGFKSKGLGIVLDGAKSWSKIDKIGDAYGDLKSGGLSTYKTIDKGLDIIGNLPIVDAFTGDLWKIISSPVKVVQAMVG